MPRLALDRAWSWSCGGSPLSARWVSPLQSGVREQLKEIRGRRNAKIEEKKQIRAQMQALKRVELVRDKIR